MMTAATMLPDMRTLARPLPPVLAAAASIDFAGILDSSGMAPDAALGNVTAVLPPAPAIGPAILPVMPNTLKMQTGAADIPQPLPASAAPVASLPLAASLENAAVPSTAKLAVRAVLPSKAIPAATAGYADPQAVPVTETSPEDIAIDQAASLPASVPDVFPSSASDLPSTGELQPAVQPASAPVDARAFGSVPATATAAVPATAATVALTNVQATKSPALVVHRPAARSDTAVVAPTDQLPLALPSTSWLTLSDGTSAEQTGSISDMLPLLGAASAASSPVAAAQPAFAVGDPSLRLLNLGDDNRWIASLAQDIAALQGDDGLLRFQLLPRQLGRIEVSVQTGSEGVSVRVAAENVAAQSVLAAAQARLVDDLRNNGVRIVAADIGMQFDGGAHDRRDNDRSNPDQRWNFVETGHAADPVPHCTGRPDVERLA
jgi:flagellar hook-length control protein FliK